jgi:hypothetical protein
MITNFHLPRSTFGPGRRIYGHGLVAGGYAEAIRERIVSIRLAMRC